MFESIRIGEVSKPQVVVFGKFQDADLSERVLKHDVDGAIAGAVYGRKGKDVGAGLQYDREAEVGAGLIQAAALQHDGGQGVVYGSLYQALRGGDYASFGGQ